MRAIIEPPPEPGAPLAPLWKRLSWFAGLAVSGAAATAIVAYALRALLR
ncbi:DUF2474 domain-containing protein [Phenylobacterium sp.]|nr:DUF2474 domain-containing protein [Phenylobacterium sp.]THD59489.1 MAG: DUF2474 domain-containing protein [Phenylobacterium sp.]